MAHRIYGISCHISATNIHTKFAPANLRIALAGNNPDSKYGIRPTMRSMMDYKDLKYLLRLLLPNI